MTQHQRSLDGVLLTRRHLESTTKICSEGWRRKPMVAQGIGLCEGQTDRCCQLARQTGNAKCGVRVMAHEPSHPFGLGTLKSVFVIEPSTWSSCHLLTPTSFDTVVTYILSTRSSRHSPQAISRNHAASSVAGVYRNTLLQAVHFVLARLPHPSLLPSTRSTSRTRKPSS